MSPEQVEKKPYNHKVDIYSLGLILFELLVPFKTQMERIDTMTKLKKLEFPKEFIDQPECELVKSMLEHDPGKRPEVCMMINLTEKIIFLKVVNKLNQFHEILIVVFFRPWAF